MDHNKPLSLKKQFIVSMLFISAILLIVLGSVMYHISKQTLEKNYKETHAYNMELFSSSIHLWFQDITKVSRDLLENELFIETMKNDNSKTNYFSAYGQQELEKTLNEIDNDNSSIQGVLVVNAKGQFRYITKRSASADIMNEFYSTGKILQQEWTQVADEAKGKEVFYGYNVLDSNDEEMMSMVKRLNQPITGDLIGYLVINLEKSMIEQTLETKMDSTDGNSYFIIDTEEKREKISGQTQVVYYNLTDDKLLETLQAYQNENSTKYLFTTYHDSMSEWDIVSVIDRKELSRQSNYIKWVMLLGIILLMSASWFVADIISKRFNRPLELLEQTINQVGEGKYILDTNFDNSEIGVVGQHFVDMAAHNLELRDRLLNSEIKEREAELLLLQSQINPHFLYNTLDSIYFMAVIEQADDIAEAVKNLSDMFKLSLNKGDKTITVKSELEKVQAYMKIQNLRYRNRFELDIDIEDEIMGKKILTFIIQPLIENAVTHGLEKKIGNGIVSVIGYRENGDLYFTIHDNGVGISDMDLLNCGYGVRNIRERIILFYGKNYGLSFESNIGGGTTVFLHIPEL